MNFGTESQMIRKEVPSMSAGDADGFKDPPMYKKLTYTNQTKNKNEILNNMLHELGIDNDSSDDEDYEISDELRMWSIYLSEIYFTFFILLPMDS